MHLLMLETRRGSEDGFAVRLYPAGGQYYVADGLAQRFLACDAARLLPFPLNQSSSMTEYSRRRLVRYTAPSSEPVTLAEAKLFLKVDQTADDTVISDLIVAVRIAAEDYLRRSLMTQSWKLVFDDWLPDESMLPYGPVQSVTSVTAYDAEDNATVLDSAFYHLDAAKEHLVADNLVSAHRVEIVYQAGYGSASDVPKAIKQALLMHVAGLYDNRSSGAMPETARALLQPYRVFGL